MKKLFLLFSLLLFSLFTYAADSSKKSADTLSYYDAIKANMHLLAEKLDNYDSLYICAFSDEEFVIVTDSAICKNGKLDGYYTMIAKLNSEGMLDVFQIAPLDSSYSFNKHVFSFIGKKKPALLSDYWWQAWERPYSAILVKDKIVYEYVLPICDYIGPNTLTEEESATICCVFFYYNYKYEYGF